MAFADTPELFTGAHEIGVVWFAVSASYIAGWPVYYFAVFKPRERARSRATTQIAKQAYSLAGTAAALRDGLLDAVGRSSGTIPREELRGLTTQLTFGAPADIHEGFVMRRGTVLDLFFDVEKRAQRFADQVLRVQSLDPEWIASHPVLIRP